ncbi:MAG: type IV toxin-antitoxin system AbiEi family antitoxin, partial [Flavobacteriaceae bacterium]|nr:type IV toxin-antitoxin system AbiEi family antitoxin [Flavobacteriaceae bacterium]
YTEVQLLEKALEALHKATGIDFTIEGREKKFNNNRIADAIVRLVKDGLDQVFVIEVKPRLTTATVGMAINQLKEFPQKGIIVTDYVNPNMADRLREKDVQFIDIAGNAYLTAPNLFIFIKGNKPIELPKKGKTRAFQPTGLKVLFAFLCQPKLVNAPYREIAYKAQVALGTVGWVLTDLRETGFVIELGRRGRKLYNKKKLLDRWVEAYPENLRPKLIAGGGRYKADRYDWWKFTTIEEYGAYWGGEVAAAKLTEYLKPQIATIYTKDDPKELILENRFLKDPEGNVEILKVFWEFKYDWNYRDLVPPLLIYADLIATGDDRNLETAKIIYEREIARYIRED